MGRKQLHRPKSELVAERRERQKRYYYKHKDKLNEKTMQRYWKRKNMDSKLGADSI